MENTLIVTASDVQLVAKRDFGLIIADDELSELLSMMNADAIINATKSTFSIGIKTELAHQEISKQITALGHTKIQAHKRIDVQTLKNEPIGAAEITRPSNIKKSHVVVMPN